MLKNKLFKLAFLVLFTGVSQFLSAQIVYTDIVPDTVVSADTATVIKSYYVNLDNNGGYEIELRHFNPGGGFAAVEIHNNTNVQVMLGGDGHALVLSAGTVINAGAGTWGNDGFGILDDSWYGSTDKFFGVRFQVGGQWHYAWVRALLPASKLSFTIKDYAYAATAEQSIAAGSHFNLGANLPQQASPRIYPNPSCNEFRMDLPTGYYELEICDLSGRILGSRVFNSMESISSAELENGTYILRVKNSEQRVYSMRLIVSR